MALFVFFIKNFRRSFSFTDRMTWKTFLFTGHLRVSVYQQYFHICCILPWISCVFLFSPTHLSQKRIIGIGDQMTRTYIHWHLEFNSSKLLSLSFDWTYRFINNLISMQMWNTLTKCKIHIGCGGCAALNTCKLLYENISIILCQSLGSVWRL